MKKIVVAVLSLALLCAFGNGFEDELNQVETWISANYRPGSRAYKFANARLDTICNSQKSEQEKIMELHKQFPKAFPPAEIENLIVTEPLIWKIHSLSLGYDIQEGTAAETKTVDIVKELNSEEVNHRNTKSDQTVTRKSKGFDLKGDVSTGVGVKGSVDAELGMRRIGDLPVKIIAAGSLQWFLNAKGSISGHYEKNRTDQQESCSVWNEKNQQMFQRNRDKILSMINQTAIKNLHLTFTVTLINQTRSSMYFKLDSASIPVYMNNRSCNNPAKPFRNSSQIIELIPMNPFGQDVVFRMELDTTSARELVDFMTKDTPRITLEQGIIEIVDSKKKNMLTKRNALPDSDFSHVVLSGPAGSLSWKIRRYHALGRKVTIDEACEAISQDVKKYKDPLFMKNEKGGFSSVSGVPFGFGKFRTQGIPNEIAFLEYKGEFYSEIPTDLLKKPIENDGFIIHFFDDPKRVKIQNPKLFQAYTRDLFEWTRKAAEQGHPGAQFLLGVDYEEKKDYDEAVKWYQKAADQGHAGAQCFLGICYENGQGVEKKPTEAVKWYQKAADQGHAGAQCFLGICYENGQGVKQDYAEAVKWFRLAADKGDFYAQNSLGKCYYDGRGVEQNLEEAVKWYQKAANKDLPQAQNYLGMCYYNGKGVEENLEKAFEWCMKAAKQDNSDAQYNIGLFYLYGYGVPEDMKESIKWFKKAAAQGDKDAEKALQNLNQ